ncbi:MAG: hypothetical protein DLM61_21465 [Pseudonocardiales bacterium]|nr:MAG: hypothetical protein DLM61_21465 [Pseudonocardiales bacterium]
MLLDVALTILVFVGLFVFAAFLSIKHKQLLQRRRRCVAQEGHRRAKLHLHEVLQTVPGAQLVVVQRVISSSLRGTRAVVLWTSTGIVYELWFAHAYMEPGDSLAIVGADPSTGRVEARSVLTRSMANAFGES